MGGDFFPVDTGVEGNVTSEAEGEKVGAETVEGRAAARVEILEVEVVAKEEGKVDVEEEDVAPSEAVDTGTEEEEAGAGVVEEAVATDDGQARRGEVKATLGDDALEE